MCVGVTTILFPGWAAGSLSSCLRAANPSVQDIHLDLLHEQDRLGAAGMHSHTTSAFQPLYSQSLARHLSLWSGSIIFAEQLN